MSAKDILTVVLPYAAAAALVVLVVAGKLDPTLAAALATALAVPSPLQHAITALRGDSAPPDGPAPS